MSICDKVKKELGNELRHLVDLTHASKKEWGASICQENSELSLAEKCAGTECDVFAKACAIEKKDVGWFHSHPIADNTPSSSDVETAIDQKIPMTCISDVEGKMTCGEYARMPDLDHYESLESDLTECYIDELEKQPFFATMKKELEEQGKDLAEIDEAEFKAMIANAPSAVHESVTRRCKTSQEKIKRFLKRGDYDFCEINL